MPTTAAKSVSTRAGEFWEGRLDGALRHARIPSWSPSFAHHDGRHCVRVNRTLPRCTAGIRLAFWREPVASPTAATQLPSRQCRVNGALLDKLVLRQGSPSFVQCQLTSRTLRRTLRYGCISGQRWELRSHRKPPVTQEVSSKAKHMNFLELPSQAGSHVREQRQDRYWHLWIRAWGLGAVSKGRSSSRKINFLLRKLGSGASRVDVALELVWVPTWANPADASSRNKPIKSWHASLPKPPLDRPRFSRQSMPFRSWICSVSHCRLRHIRQKNMHASLNPPVPSVVRK